MRRVLTSLTLALSLASLANAQGFTPTERRGAGILDVPYLPQTEALCGGAAVAMVFRYWGERHVAVHEFAELVDVGAKGIADDVLMKVVRERGWEAIQLAADIDLLREQVATGHPIILLLQDRPGRYHYVVAVGADIGHIFVHDPAWGPSRPYTPAALRRAWQPSRFWALLVLPGAGQEPAVTQRLSAFESRQGASVPQPQSLGELAGIWFAQRRWEDASRLAAKAVAIDPSDGYAWDVLGSSRFIQDDLPGALQAWNHVNKPRLDSVRIGGLTRTRYSIVADTLRLTPNTLLTEEAFRLAQRRLEQFPDQLTSRIAYRPDADGYATIDIAIVERPSWPRGAAAWTATAARTLVDREMTTIVPDGTSQGGLWSASWRWWLERSRVAMSFAAPRAGPLPGLWRVDASWEAQSYGTRTEQSRVHEERVHGGIAIADWLTPNWRYELSAGGDSWNNTRRALSLGGAIEHRLLSDRVSVAASAHQWLPVSKGNGFEVASLRAGFRSSPQPAGSVGRINVGVESASIAAPLSTWPGAGEGQARTPLLRAHPLLDGGVIDGPAFGRRLSWLTLEGQRWFGRPVWAPIGVAIFTDFARARGRLDESAADKVQVDAGMGMRLRIPGCEGALRVDYAHGLRDGNHALTLGWQY